MIAWGLWYNEGMSEQDLPDKQPSSGGPQEAINQPDQLNNNSSQLISQLNPEKSIKGRCNSRLYSQQRLCKAKARNGAKCRAIALAGSDYCRSHAKLPPMRKLMVEYERHPHRYTLNSTELQRFYENDIDAKNITAVRDELALLHSYIDKLNRTPEPTRYKYFADGSKIELPPGPIPWLYQQLDIMKNVRGMALAYKKMELQDKFFNKANEAIKSTITQIVLIIDRCVTDNNLKSVIAGEIFKLSGKENEPVSIVDMSAIDTEKYLKASSTEKKEMVDNTKVTSSGPSELKKEERSSSAMIETFARQTDAAEMIPV